ncbi:MAG: TVP38/TMEM64 family protein [Gemmatimonadota bacterium]
MADILAGWIEGSGPWGHMIALVGMTAVAVLPLPAEAPALVLGALFGPILGSALVWTGAMLGAAISFELARTFGRPAAKRWLSPRSLGRADDVARRAGVAGLLLLRLMPWVGFTALNWALGLSDLPRSRFLWTTALGILPGVALFTGAGAGFRGLLPDFEATHFGGLVLIVAVGWAVSLWVRRKRTAASGRSAPQDEDQ